MVAEGPAHIAELKRALARQRVRDQPVFEWLFDRFVVTEELLRETVRRGAVDEEECRRVLRANGNEASTSSPTLVRESQDIAHRASSVAPADAKPALLLVDDDQLLLRTMKRVLRACYHVSASTNPDDALRVLHEQHVDVLVSDYEMPDTRGGL